MSAKLSEDEKKTLLAIQTHLACLKQSGFSHASIVVEQVLILLELPNVQLYLESIAAALESVVKSIQKKRRGAGWHIGVIIRDLERLTLNLLYNSLKHNPTEGRPTNNIHS